MSVQNIRFIFIIIIFIFIFLLFNSWKNNEVSETYYSKENVNIFNNDASNYYNLDNDNIDEIKINTNLFFIKINLYGGNINYLELKMYPKDLHDLNNGIIIFNKNNSNHYLPQSGFYNNSEKKFKEYLYKSIKSDYVMDISGSDLIINLTNNIDEDIKVNKIYKFKSYSYEIEVTHEFYNNSNFVYSVNMYGLLKYEKENVKSSIFNVTNRSYEGGAVYTKNSLYKKLSFSDIDNKKFSDVIHGGWIAILQHYFISSWIPENSENYVYSAEKLSNKLYIFKYICENKILIDPGNIKKNISTLYVGPKTKNTLNKLCKGMDLSIDYGIFWPIASPIFLLLDKMNSLVNNWGFSIILITIIIKLLFFHLSSMSYRSMGNLKKIQPKIEILKGRCNGDKKKFGQAVMELYKKERVNPLGGCLPILIQIPVFISLYYVLLESVELRQAPFVFWINDLSDKDMYYILPVIMSVTMFIQQKLNPPIQDSTQAKIMMFMPIIFLFMFLQFPSGLILYWIVNNILSIVQQWIIMKRVEDL